MLEKLFKRKIKDNQTTLEKAKAQGLITDEEFLELIVKRATQRLKNYQEKNKKGKK